MASVKFKKLLWLLAGIVTGVLITSLGKTIFVARIVSNFGAFDLPSVISLSVTKKQIDFTNDQNYDSIIKDFKYFTGKELQDDFKFITEEDFLREHVQILCFAIFAERKSLDFEAIINTWSRQCNEFVIYTATTFGYSKSVPIVPRQNDSAGHVLRHLVNNYMGNCTWFVFVPTKTYLMAENLRRVLVVEDYTRPLVIGSAERPWSSLGSGMSAAPVALSRSALLKCAVAESPEVRQCLSKAMPGGLTCAAHVVSSKFIEPYDENGCSLFLSLPAGVFHYSRQSSVVWRDEIMKTTCCPQFPISFSTVDASKLYDLHWFTHHLTVYGRRNVVGGKVRIIA